MVDMIAIFKFLLFVTWIVHCAGDCGFADSAYSFSSFRLYPLGSPDVNDLRPANGGHSFFPADAYNPGGDDYFLEITITMDQFRNAVPVTGVKLLNPSSAISGFKVQFNQVTSWDSVPITLPGGTVSRLETDSTTRIIIAFVSDNLLTGSTAQVEIVVPCSVPNSYPIVSGDADCDAGWLKFDEHCYKFVKTPVQRWENAKLQCANMSATLLQIDSVAELDWIRGLLLDTTTGLCGQRRYWTSGFLDGTTWKWDADGSDITVFLWGHKEPNNLHGKETCVNLLDKRLYKYNDSNCKRKQGFICRQAAA